MATPIPTPVVTSVPYTEDIDISDRKIPLEEPEKTVLEAPEKTVVSFLL